MVTLDTHWTNVHLDVPVVGGATGLYPSAGQHHDVLQASGTPQEERATGLVASPSPLDGNQNRPAVP